MKRMKKDPPSGNIRPKDAGGEVPRNRAPVLGFVARPEAVTACGCWLACASIPVKRIRKDTHQGMSTPSTRGDRCPETGHLSLGSF